MLSVCILKSILPHNAIHTFIIEKASPILKHLFKKSIYACVPLNNQGNILLHKQLHSWYENTLTFKYTRTHLVSPLNPSYLTSLGNQ